MQNVIIQDLAREFPEEISDITCPRPRRAWLSVKKEALRKVVERLVNRQSVTHLSTITAVDIGQEIQALYHFWVDGMEISLRVSLPKDDPELPTIIDLVPGATYYEREIHDLAGIHVSGRGRLDRLMVTDDWPEGHYPLRKDWKGLPGGENDA